MPDPGHPRLDVFLKAHGHFPSREAAQAAVREGRVMVEGRPAARASLRVKPGDRVTVTPGPAPYVSRGGRKLEAALQAFPLGVAGRVALDVGAATGGFTDCLLRHGAAVVHAVDVGSGQLHPSLRADPRVRVREDTDIRDLKAGDLDPVPGLAAVDVSFISARLVLPAVVDLLDPAGPGALVVLVKPQFEAGRGRVKKGVVRPAAVHRRVLEAVVTAASRLDLAAGGLVRSPLRGPCGNLEFLLYLTRVGPPVVDAGLIRRVVEEAHREEEG